MRRNEAGAVLRAFGNPPVKFPAVLLEELARLSEAAPVAGGLELAAQLLPQP